MKKTSALIISAATLFVAAVGCGRTEKHPGEWQKACIENLSRIGGCKSQWALENGKGPKDIPTLENLKPYFKDQLPSCPAGGAYTVHAVERKPECSVNGHNLRD